MVLALRRAGSTSASIRNADRLFGVTTGNRMIKRIGVTIGPRLTPIGSCRYRAAISLEMEPRQMIDVRPMAFQRPRRCCFAVTAIKSEAMAVDRGQFHVTKAPTELRCQRFCHIANGATGSVLHCLAMALRANGSGTEMEIARAGDRILVRRRSRRRLLHRRPHWRDTIPVKHRPAFRTLKGGWGYPRSGACG